MAAMPFMLLPCALISMEHSMDTLFFWASKLIWALISPDSLLLVLIVASWLLLWTGMRRTARLVLGTACLITTAIAFLPLGEWLYYPLETRFESNPTLPAEVDGILVLGGALRPVLTETWGQTQTNEAAERLQAFAALARRYPEATLAFTGGSGDPRRQEQREADAVVSYLQQMGLGEREVVLESDSRNTWENAVYSKSLLSPGRDERWILITSAFHMPRAVGIFCQQDWPVLPWPVDHRSERGNLLRIQFQFAFNLLTLREASREWTGLLAYAISGKSDSLLPDGRCRTPRQDGSAPEDYSG